MKQLGLSTTFHDTGTIEPESGVTMLNIVVEKNEQCADNIVQFCFYQP